MEAEARYTYVGAGVLALVAALVAGLLWLARIGDDAAYATYAIHFERQSLSGLQIGAQVTLRGIRIGSVADYSLATEQTNRVRVVVRIDRRVPVHTTTAAIVTRNLVTGIADIALVQPDPPGPPLTKAEPGEPYPVIAEGRSDLDELAGRVNQVGELAYDVLASLDQLLRPENRKAVMDTVQSLRVLSTGLNQRLETLDRTLELGGRAAASIAAGADRLGATADVATRVTGRAGEQVEHAVAQAERTLEEARVALTRVAATAEAVGQQAHAAAGRIESTAAGVEDQLAAALAELRLTMEATTRVIDRLREPRTALFGPAPAQLGPGETEP